VRFLFRLRGLPEGSIQHFMAANGFTVLEHSATAYVVGLVARGRRLLLADSAAWPAAARPGTVKMAARTPVLVSNGSTNPPSPRYERGPPTSASA